VLSYFVSGFEVPVVYPFCKFMDTADYTCGAVVGGGIAVP